MNHKIRIIQEFFEHTLRGEQPGKKERNGEKNKNSLRATRWDTFNENMDEMNKNVLVRHGAIRKSQGDHRQKYYEDQGKKIIDRVRKKSQKNTEYSKAASGEQPINDISSSFESDS